MIPSSSPGVLSVSDALAKAKAIAAKLAQTSALQDSSCDMGLMSKRKRWSNDETDDGDGDKRSKMEEKYTKKVWIPVEKNPGYNYVGLLIGPGGSKQKALQLEAGGRVKIQVRGKGSNSTHNSNMSSGQRLNEEELHVLLEGDKDCVQRAESLINELLLDTSKADAEKGRQLAEMGIATSSTNAGSHGSNIDGNGDYSNGANHSNQENGFPSSSSYKPMPVAQLIGQAMSGGIYGPGSTGEMLEEKMGVPNGVVGYIIGKGGESITSMQRRSGCRVQIQKEHEMAAGTNIRVITLSAATKDQVNQCRTIIEQMVEERQRLNQQQNGNSNHNGGMQLDLALAQGQQLVTVQVPDADVGLIIGKGGVNIRSMQDRSGANIQIPPHADADNPLIRTVSITHLTMDGANFAKQMVEDILRNKIGGGGVPTGGGSTESSIHVLIPDKDVGMVIGRSGCVIREMQSKTRTRIQIPSQPTAGQVNRIATVTGPSDGTQQVKQMIERMVMEQSSQSVMTGTNFTSNFMQGGQQTQIGGGVQYAAGQYGQGAGMMYSSSQYGQQYQQQSYQGYAAQTVQATAATSQYQAAQQGTGAAQQKSDYSAEWAAYFAAQQGMNGTSAASAGAVANANSAATNAILSASAGTPSTAALVTSLGTSATDSSSQNQDPTAYYDAFWRYAHYYGEDASRKYYGAWSPPPGTPNPYAQSQPQAQGGSPQTKPDASTVKDSSARKVSNLPAWMTKT